MFLANIPQTVTAKTGAIICKAFGGSDCGGDGGDPRAGDDRTGNEQGGDDGDGDGDDGSDWGPFNFLKGPWSTVYQIGDAVVDDVTGIIDLVKDPSAIVDAVTYIVENPIDAAKQLVWDDETQDLWDKGDYWGVGGRLIWNIGSWAIPYVNIGKAAGKVGKLGKLGKIAGSAGKVSKLAREAQEAAAKAKRLADSGDLDGARKAAEEARRKADEAREEARRAGCKAISLGPPRPTGGGALFGRLGGVAVAAGAAATAPEEPCKNASDAQQARDAAQRAVERAQLKKDIEAASKAGRFDDADRLVQRLQANADAAREAARKNPTQANKDAANQAQREVDAIRNKLVDDKIDHKARSSSPDDRLEAKTAKAIRGIVRDFDRGIDNPAGGRLGQIDIETNKAIIEVSNGTNANKATQVKSRLSDPRINPSGKSIVVYAPKWTYAQVKEYASQGITVVRNEGELKRYLRGLGENI
ncbi:hypothetical protein [Actinomadura sp. NBRC 104412]|uniref:hypothetical protein n=1 Tax=Actinomadura sp. NBRC 104412 TaxID=3032203 RepID=UPI0025546725|nr:hypothetical protein [Actinomadura sp. NBRC 104412]